MFNVIYRNKIREGNYCFRHHTRDTLRRNYYDTFHYVLVLNRSPDIKRDNCSYL